MKYLHANNLPPRILPVFHWLGWWVILDHFDAAGWVYGVVYCLLGILLVAEWVRLLLGQAVDIFKEKKE